MQVSRLAGLPASAAAPGFAAEFTAAAAVLNKPTGASNLGRQLDSYRALAGRWGQAGHAERAQLAQALTESTFGRRVHATLNAFTRAAWAGPDAVPPEPQAQIVKAFDGLSDTDRQIVAAMHVDPSTGAGFRSADAYRASLQADLEASQVLVAARRPDTVTLSAEAQARLAGQAPSDADAPGGKSAVEAQPEVAVAIAAYRKLDV